MRIARRPWDSYDCTNVVKSGEPAMTQGKGKSVRATVSFPADHYTILERLAEEKKVSVAWVVREAVERYIDAQWPLLAGTESENGEA